VFTSIPGDERRDIVDLRFSGTANGLDWDIEGMNQTGRIGAQTINARAFGSLAGYTFPNVGWTPRVGMSVDVSTGDRNPYDNKLETLNPLFPNGYYLAGYTGYPNLIHLKPTMTVHPARAANVMVALASQWRETTADAIYTFPNFPIAETAGRSGRYTGAYGECRADWAITSHYSVSLEAVHYSTGKAIRQANGNSANYLGIEFRYGW
jgi:hypothetical protein